MDTRNEHEVNQILRSLEGAQRAEAPPFLLTRIRARLEEVVPVRITPTRVWLAAASFALLAALNFVAIDSKLKNRHPDAMKAVIHSYGLNPEPDFFN